MKYALLAIVSLSACCCLAQSFDYEILKEVSHFQLKGNKMSQSDTTVIQVNNRMGEREILIPYSKGDKVSISEARIEDSQGNTVYKLRSKDISDRSYISDISLYEDDYVKAFYLKHNEYPYRIVYSTGIQYKQSLGSVHIDHARRRIPVRSGTLIVEVPVEDSIKYKASQAGDCLREVTEGTKKYTWQYNYSPTPYREMNSSINLKETPSIDVVPLHFKFGETGSFASWQSLGNWVYRLNKNRDRLPESEQQEVDALIAGIDDEREKARILYQYLQDHTRYINVSIKLGGLQTYPAEYVSKHKYGDCKALVNYMQALLKYAGIRSYYTLINAGDRVLDIDPDFPAQKFNHVILTIPFERDTVFLECTNKNAPFGYLGCFTQGRWALLVDENDSQLIKTPALTADEVICSRQIRVAVDKEEVSLHSILRGNEYERFNYLARDVDKHTVDKFIRRNILSGSYELSEYRLDEIDRQSASIGLHLEAKQQNIGKRYGKNLLLSGFPLNIPMYETPEKRSLPVQLDYPEQYRDTLVYLLEEDVPDKKPTVVSFESPYGNYCMELSMDGKTVTCHKSFTLYAGRYEQDEYEDFYRFISQVKNAEHQKLHLELP